LIDYNKIEPVHSVIHQRLINWARWVRVTPQSVVSPMFRMYQSKSRQWHAPEIRETVDLIDAQHIEKTMRHIPHNQRQALMWFYVYPTLSPAKVRGLLSLTHKDLADLLRTGRQMVLNLAETA
jgi:hypothetical protein